MEWVNYNGRLYDVYWSIEDYKESGKAITDLVYSWQLSQLISDETPLIVGKYLVPRGTQNTKRLKFPIMMILSVSTRYGFVIETPAGLLELRNQELLFKKGQFVRDRDFDFIASYLLTGNLLSSYNTVYCDGKGHVHAIHKFIEVINRHDLKQKVYDFMKEHNLKNVFDSNGFSMEELLKGWHQSLMEEGKPKDWKEAYELRQGLEVEQKISNASLPDIPSKRIELHN